MPGYFVVQGDNHVSVYMAVNRLVEAGVMLEAERPNFEAALTFGVGYKRAVRDNVDRALYSLLNHGEHDRAVYWLDRARDGLG
jgi:hypothetical protein